MVPKDDGSRLKMLEDVRKEVESLRQSLVKQVCVFVRLICLMAIAKLLD